MATQPTRRTMEDICTIPGTKVPSIPQTPPDSVPNLESIRKVYDIAFAAGLDKFLESSNQWFTHHGFDLLASNRSYLGLMLAYLTLVSNNHDAPINHNPTLVSQEARVVWAMLSLCTTPTPNSNVRDEEADILARRFRTIESILTSEPLLEEPTGTLPGASTLSLSEFVHTAESDDNDSTHAGVTDNQSNINMSSPVSHFSATFGGDPTQQLHAQQLSQLNSSLLLSAPTVSPSPFASQLARRTFSFWSTLENIAASQQPSSLQQHQTSQAEQALYGPLNQSTNPYPSSSQEADSAAHLSQLRSLLDGRENRDILYSACLLHFQRGNPDEKSSERELGRAFLQNEFSGRAAATGGGGSVFGSLAGMVLRAGEMRERELRGGVGE